ncbi:DNA-directed RNA polymerase I subunit rpa49 [Podospora fimiseda]|uniref:DNA-directed RNA polymerase I subunit rpa49 n=1 Tax=Podospora fimiseda TaxID=252190 RepID=A0AAN7BXM9_9PEZI|nr:DNA-directed RNA polymerase I subunit rpa49 [Podospora fimiseda]
MADSSQKKRRRPAEDVAKPKKSKLSKLEQPGFATTWTFAAETPKQQAKPPVIAVTPGFNLHDYQPFDVYEKADKSAAKRRRISALPPATELALHSSAHNSLDYNARESEPLLNHWVAILDPKIGEINIIPAKKMVVRHKVRSKSVLDDSFANRAAQTHIEKRTALGEEFGTKKAKKALKAVADNAIMANDRMGVAERNMLDSVQDASKNMATKEELQAAVDNARPVPRGNFDAEEIQDVYIPEQIIGTEVFNAIPVMDWQDAVKKRENIKLPSRFVANRINRVASNENAVHRLKVMRYFLWVFILYYTAGKGRERGTKSIAKRDKLRELLAPAPEVVVENIRRKFSDNGVMRKSHVDLLMTHCCVFACLIDNFEVNMFDLREDLKLEQNQLQLYFQEIGARIKQSKSGDKITYIAKLALPLQFPKMRQPIRRK